MMMDKNIWFVILVIILASFLIGGFSYMPMQAYEFSGMWAFMWILGILLIVILILGILWLIKQLRK